MWLKISCTRFGFVLEARQLNMDIHICYTHHTMYLVSAAPTHMSIFNLICTIGHSTTFLSWKVRHIVLVCPRIRIRQRNLYDWISFKLMDLYYIYHGKKCLTSIVFNIGYCDGPSTGQNDKKVGVLIMFLLFL